MREKGEPGERWKWTNGRVEIRVAKRKKKYIYIYIKEADLCKSWHPSDPNVFLIVLMKFLKENLLSLSLTWLSNRRFKGSYHY